MRLDRRTFLASAAGAGFAGRNLLGAASRPGRSRELDPKGLTRAEIPTPALLLDLDAFEFNLNAMAEHCRGAACAFRPHAKTHKCPEIARRQVAAGALGVCVATVPEAEAMVDAEIPGVLLTSPIVERGKIGRMVQLAANGRDVLLAAGSEREIELLSEAARESGVTVGVLIDVDVVDRRTGALPGSPALELARRVDKARSLRLRGLQAYAGGASHVVGFRARARASRDAMSKAFETRELFRKSGLDASILSGGSTGTYNIDSATGGVTELQVGSYVFMDVGYRRIGSRTGDAVYSDFRPSLTVLTTVVSAAHRDLVTVDAGVKAFAPSPVPEAKERTGLSYRPFGDEFGAVSASGDAELPRLGDRLEFIAPHCDPTVNLYDHLYAMRGDKVEAIWPIAARREFART